MVSEYSENERITPRRNILNPSRENLATISKARHHVGIIKACRPVGPQRQEFSQTKWDHKGTKKGPERCQSEPKWFGVDRNGTKKEPKRGQSEPKWFGVNQDGTKKGSKRNQGEPKWAKVNEN